jgi:hypothetical protein
MASKEKRNIPLMIVYAAATLIWLWIILTPFTMATAAGLVVVLVFAVMLEVRLWRSRHLLGTHVNSYDE